ncbi:hypothetical protein F4703DRAFT_1981779 [Phycomyces blakesleeanus]
MAGTHSLEQILYMITSLREVIINRQTALGHHLTLMFEFLPKTHTESLFLSRVRGQREPKVLGGFSLVTIVSATNIGSIQDGTSVRHATLVPEIVCSSHAIQTSIKRSQAQLLELKRKFEEWEDMALTYTSITTYSASSPSLYQMGFPFVLQFKALFINEPTLTVEAVTDQLCGTFKDIQITSRSIATHMKNKFRLTYKRIVPQYFALDSKKYVIKRHIEVSSWISRKLDFFNDCVFIDETGFNRNMYTSYGWSVVWTPCKIKVETKGPNVSILGAISKDGIITLSRKKIITTAVAGKIQRLGDTRVIKKKNKKTQLAVQRGYLVLLAPYSPFLDPIEEFWPKLKNVVNYDPSLVRQNTKISERIFNASIHVSKEDCQSWINHSLSF